MHSLNFYKNEFNHQLKYISNISSANRRLPYVGWTGFDNLGDEILYDAHLKLFNKLELFQYRESRIIDLFQKNHKYPFAILGGGTFIFQSEYWLRQVEHLLNSGANMFCLGTGVAAGSYLKSETGYWNDQREEWIKLLERFSFVGVRGPLSQRMLQEQGLEKSIVVGDTALSLTPPTYKTKKRTKIVGINYGLNKSQSIWGEKNNFTKQMVLTIKELITNGFEVRVLPIFKDDIESNYELLNLVNSKKCRLIINYSSFKDYSKELNQCDIFLGQKLHSVIMATMNRIPSIMIEYNPKCRDYMCSLDLEKYTIKTTEFKSKKIMNRISELYNSYTETQKHINKKVLYYKNIQAENANNLRKQILSQG